MDVLDMYQHLSLSIWPQSQITELNLCFKAILCKPYISISWPIFVLKDNYNRYYHKICRNVTSPSKCQLFLLGKIALSHLPPTHTPQKKQTNQETDQSLLVPGKYQKSLSTHEKKKN